VSSAREEVIGRIRTALADLPRTAAVNRCYRGPRGRGDIALFVDRVAEYRATVRIDASIGDVLAARGITRIVVPDGFPHDLLPSPDRGVELVREPVDTAILDDVNAVLTICRLGVAETGTIVLDHGPGMGPRMLTLVPDYHVVVVRRDQISAGIPDAIAALDPTRPLTWISGPSATSDIELNRVEGVHGPRILDVVVTS